MTDRLWSIGEEISHSVTHGVGLLIAIAGAAVLMVVAWASGNASVIACYGIYAATLIAVYTTSTIYHALPRRRAKVIFQSLDRSAIYLLIAGTATPFALLNLRGPWGDSLAAVEWGLATIGVVGQAVVPRRMARISLPLYASMGWLVVVAPHQLMAHIPRGGLIWIAAGGLLYTGGIAFYALDRFRYAHMIWHLFVLAGSACHYVAVLWYAAPPGPLRG
jgi:hemolysin III